MLALGVVLAADILARVLTLLLVVLAVGGGVLVAGLIGYVVLACRRYQQQDTWLNAAPRGWPDVPGDPPRAVLDDPVHVAAGDHRTASPAPGRPRRSACS